MTTSLPVGVPETVHSRRPIAVEVYRANLADFDLAVATCGTAIGAGNVSRQPASVMIGLKLSDDQRDALNCLAAAPDTLLDRLRHVWPTD